VSRYRLSEPAKADIAAILRTSRQYHGPQAQLRYRALLSAAMRRIAADPENLCTVGRRDLTSGMRSFHIRHSRTESRETAVANPVHIIFYRQRQPALVEIIRVLHERMDPTRHIRP
jgi:toxin ParE1/3/4